MHVVVIGMSHRTAPIEVRERLALTDATRHDVMDAVRDLPSVDECVVVSTCNRLEVYAVVSRFHEAMEHLVDLLAGRAGMRGETLLPYLYTYHHHQAARHLFRVACGLDSMILGETQILGQVREAYQDAQAAGTVGKVLHELFQRALRVGKRAHAETAIGDNAASISSVAVELARAEVGGLSGRTVLVLGAGEMAELAAEILHDQGAAILVANRTLERAEELAHRFEGRPVPLQEVAAALEQADIAIVSTAAAEHLVTVDMLGRATARRTTPLLIVDISVPRNVAPEAGMLPGVRLYHVDDLQAVVQENLRQREREVPRVEEIIRNEVTGFSRWLEELYVIPLIRSLREMAEDVRREETARLLARLPELDERQRQVIETATSVIVNRILNEPTARLRRYAGDDHAEMYVRAIGELFNLPGFASDPGRR